MSELTTIMWFIPYIILNINIITYASEMTSGCWPNNLIPYKLLNGFSFREQEKIHYEIGELNRKSCVRWVNVASVKLNVTDYVAFRKIPENTVCQTTTNTFSNGDQQVIIDLGKRCFTKAVLVHEMMHAMGFPHEQQRADRDCYVIVDENNVELYHETREYVIKHHRWLERFPYDKSSLMHYPRTIILKARTEKWYTILFEPLGNIEGELTFLDIWKIWYRFCGFPHFCDAFPEICFFMDEVEKSCVKPESREQS